MEKADSGDRKAPVCIFASCLKTNCMRIAFLTLGCKLNYAETSTYERGFIAAGLEPVGWNEHADVYLVNTCSVTQHSDNKCRNIIRKCHRIAPEAAIVVTGCYAQLRREEVAAIEGVRLVFGAREKGMVVEGTLRMLGLAKDGSPLPEAPVDAAEPAVSGVEGKTRPATTAAAYKDISRTTFGAFSAGERTRSFLKVQDGCNNFCAYCTVPFARGESRNISIAEAVECANKIASSGVKEIVLTGVNTGDFGRSTGETFTDLIKALNDVQGIERYRISSIEPNLLTDEIIDWIASGTKFMPHFHIPLQVGNDELLERMGRRYTTAEFAGRIDRIRSAMEGEGRLPVFFGIDLMAGLPGETDEKFEDTYRFISERIRPSFIHIFPYSRRPGTRADLMKDQVRDGIKTERVKRLEELCDTLHSEFVASCRGMEASVLWEGSDRNGEMEGYTDNYIRVGRPFDPEKVGKIEKVII